MFIFLQYNWQKGNWGGEFTPGRRMRKSWCCKLWCKDATKLHPWNIIILQYCTAFWVFKAFICIHLQNSMAVLKVVVKGSFPFGQRGVVGEKTILHNILNNEWQNCLAPTADFYLADSRLAEQIITIPTKPSCFSRPAGLAHNAKLAICQ